MEVTIEELDRAIAHYLWPPHWIGEQPYWERTGPQPAPDQSIIGDVIITAELPDGVRARAFRDGMIAFHLGDATPTVIEESGDAFLNWHEKCVRLANAHLACLAATLRIPHLTPTGVATLWSVMQVEFESGNFRAMTDYTGGGTRIALFDARKNPPDSFDWRFYRGRGITTEQMGRSFELLRMLLERTDKERVLQRAEMLFRATSSLVRRDWGGALINAWTACEGLLGDLLLRYLDENKDREKIIDAAGNERIFIDSDRRRWLRESSMTVRHKTEFLSLLDQLPFDLYLAARQCAKARNDWVHNETEPSGDVAHKAVSTLGALFELVEGVPLRVLWEESGHDPTAQA
ncbi:MAG TPA: hypothetical protein VGP18_11630 [Solirubrobacteraceae bacterium]|nr:hypothetical protein [Solirubrobacteraceae bacterium]